MGNLGVCANIGGTFHCKIELFGTLGYHFGLGFETARTAIPLTPMRAAGLTDIAIGDNHGCGIVGPARTVVCWGGNDRGQLGDGTNTLRPDPVGVLALSDAVDIAVGYRFSCAALATGEVRCWGENTFRQLGDGTTLNSDRPVPVSLTGTASDPVEELAAGSDFVCGRRRSGAVDCWGNAMVLGAGGGAITAPARVLTASGELAGAVELTASVIGQKACARTASGEAWCWGAVGEEHGDGTITGGLRAVRVLTAPGVPLPNVVSIATAQSHSCAVVSDGGVYCWGQGLNVLGLRRSDIVLYATRLGSLP
jgi:alpha-tubulin suppressor-like RCC1 family protein